MTNLDEIKINEMILFYLFIYLFILKDKSRCNLSSHNAMTQMGRVSILSNDDLNHMCD